MAAISEKILWPIVGIFIFGVLAGFYIDDRRRLVEEGGSTNEHAGKSAEHKQASNEHGGKAADKKASTSTKKQPASASNASAQTSSSHATTSQQAAGATSMDIDEYLAQSSNERSAELEANVTHHQGFHGGIDEYLSGAKPKAPNNTQASSSKQSNNNQANGATSMTMDEYHAKAGKSPSTQQSSDNGGAYHGGLEGYLAKYGSGTQTPMKKQSADPFNDKEHVGFHGSYEEYAKKYN